MTNFRLIICMFLCAFSYSVWADGLRTADNKLVERGDQPNVRQEKFAGRAENGADANDKSNPKAQYPLYTQQSHEKKPLTKEERRALRRQINETETKYPKRMN